MPELPKLLQADLRECDLGHMRLHIELHTPHPCTDRVAGAIHICLRCVNENSAHLVTLNYKASACCPVVRLALEAPMQGACMVGSRCAKDTCRACGRSSWGWHCKWTWQ